MRAACLCVLTSLALAACDPAPAPDRDVATKAGEARGARLEATLARRRAERLDADADAASRAAGETQRRSAAMATRIQRTEAALISARARLAMVMARQARLRVTLAKKQQPMVELAAGLQTLGRRPAALTALQPGSLTDIVHLRAVMDSAAPAIRRETRVVRQALARADRLEREARAGFARIAGLSADLAQRRAELAQLLARQRVTAGDRRRAARREAGNALVLAERSRSLDELTARLASDGATRARLAALPGPALRSEAGNAMTLPASFEAAPTTITLPAAGRLVAGFGEDTGGGRRSRGIVLAPLPGAQVTSPADGRIVFADFYRGYDRIVIVDHGAGLTSVLTGLSRTDVAVGDRVVAGQPLGLAGTGDPRLGFEMLRGGTPVNPLRPTR